MIRVWIHRTRQADTYQRSLCGTGLRIAGRAIWETNLILILKKQLFLFFFLNYLALWSQCVHIWIAALNRQHPRFGKSVDWLNYFRFSRVTSLY